MKSNSKINFSSTGLGPAKLTGSNHFQKLFENLQGKARIGEGEFPDPDWGAALELYSPALFNFALSEQVVAKIIQPTDYPAVAENIDILERSEEHTSELQSH